MKNRAFTTKQVAFPKRESDLFFSSQPLYFVREQRRGTEERGINQS